MPYLTGSILIDCPAAALNNSQGEAGAATDNIVPVKKIRTKSGTYVYASAQAVRYWIRTTLERTNPAWKAAPVWREEKVAYTDADPLTWWDDDLFGYMRAESGKAKDHKGKAAKDDKRDLTRVSPFRVSTFVSVAPVQVTSDWGVMARVDGNPVPFEHEFYRAHLQGLISLDLTSAGTFYDGERVGLRNLDSHRRTRAAELQLSEVEVRKQKAYRLPMDQRAGRVAALLRAIAHLTGGAKQAIHYTDLTPALTVMAVTAHGNNPFLRLVTANKDGRSEFRCDVLEKTLEVYGSHLLSPVYVGWQTGFLDDERKELESFVKEKKLGDKVLIDHPVVQIENLANSLAAPANAAWFD